MPVSKDYRSATEQKLAAVRPIVAKAMFGGVAIYAEGLIFAILDDDRIWFKFDEATRGDFVEHGSEQWRPSPEAPPMGYFELPDGILDDPAELAVWVDRAIGAAQRKDAVKKKKR